MKMTTAEYTHIGGRENNEDSCGIFDTGSGKLCVVADGLGGHAHGEIASRAALEVMKKNVRGALSEACLQKAAEKANGEVVRLSQEERMNTTLAALWLQDGKALAASVGDTRIYQFRGDRILFQSRDHSLAYMDAMSGDAEYADIRRNPDRNKLFRVVGMKENFKVEMTSLSYEPGDAFLLCSDGFWEEVLEREMIESRRHAADARQWLDAMRTVLQCRLHAGSDNNTAIAVMIG